ncbi:MAG: hypothetical protein COA88_07170 [Kordia sp.]|nr:MAG: hypothetical protein COA88_07170 [Kordia sp.]
MTFKQIREGKFTKVVVSYLAIQIMVQFTGGNQLFALTGGPSQPEFTSFTPIGTSDMVNLTSGDFNYNIPIMDVGGYPLNLAYDSGVTMDQEASWVGLGWNMNVGQIARNVRGLPDDFNGDEMIYENNMRKNFTVGIDTGIQFPVFGVEFINLGVGLGMKYNNYNGITFNVSYGASFDISENVHVGLQVSSAAGEGATATPSVGFHSKRDGSKKNFMDGFTSNVGVSFNSRQGISSMNMSASRKNSYTRSKEDGSWSRDKYGKAGGGVGGSLSFNDNLSFTPSSSLSFINRSIVLDFGLGLELYGSEGPQIQITGSGSIQYLSPADKYKAANAYGYANTENASPVTSILDFNREKDRTVTKNTTMLPITNYTYDIYSVQGQGVGGMYRPYRGQVGTVYDKTVVSNGFGGASGFEVGLGTALHLGGNGKSNPTTTTTGLWSSNNPALANYFVLNNMGKPDYEPIYYKMVGEMNADPEYKPDGLPVLYDDMETSNPIKIQLIGGKYSRRTGNKYDVKTYASNGAINYHATPIKKLKREKRYPRNQSVQMIKYKDVKDGQDGQLRLGEKLPNLLGNSEGSRVPDDHHVGVKIIKPDGSVYVFGETAYNTQKIEATFALGVNPSFENDDCSKEIAKYATGDNTIENSKGTDHFLSKTHTPGYAHTYLLSSVLSSDYEDLTNNGPSNDDLGAYTKFIYSNPLQYNWRVPYGVNTATYNAGLNTDIGDDKGNYIYGVKELKYIDKIETKTHIAIFDLSDREDAKGVAGEDGGPGSGKMKRIDKVSLYSKPEYEKLVNIYSTSANIPVQELKKAAIKIAHFEYDYSMCNGVDNGSSGKLTLQKVYFTYRDSNMGKYTPYQFNYAELTDADEQALAATLGDIDDNTTDNIFNPDYSLKMNDVWGNYKPHPNGYGCAPDQNTTASEFPFVQQKSKTLQNIYTKAWTLTSIELPSGGKLNLEYETDEYSHIQNKKAMEMFKVVGVGNNPTDLNKEYLYDYWTGPKDFVFVEVTPGTTDTEFKNNYLADIGASDYNPMYFKFMLNMTKEQDPKYHDYVTGYALADRAAAYTFENNGKTYGAIKVKRVKKGGGIAGGEMVSPIAKAGWYFGRQYLNRHTYGLAAMNDDDGDLLDLGQNFVSAISNVTEIFEGPNEALKKRKIAQHFFPNKSWIRLYQPTGKKLGGGCRVKKLSLSDNWDVMTGNTDNELYKNQYGQEYNYNNNDAVVNADGVIIKEATTSGIATFEPNGSRENPLVQPIYDKHDKLLAPKESNYVEKPVGESLFPSPTVSYGRVTVSNLQHERDGDDGVITLKKHATGRVINEFYTSKDYPTIADYTTITPKVDISGILGGILKVRTRQHLTYSQGYVIRTNDMNGKQKGQIVQSEGQTNAEFISKVEYKYSKKANGELNNIFDVIHPDGKVTKGQLGVSYDMINDFKSNRTDSKTVGVNMNLANLLVFIGILPVPIPLPVIQTHETLLKTAVTTKVIHSAGIMTEKIAYDLGSTVSTKNLAWDAQTGDVLLTETINEYDDTYYNFSYPANWVYKNMNHASNNLDLRGNFKTITNDNYHVLAVGQGYLASGDELHVPAYVNNDRLWVVDVNSTGDVKLMKRDGTVVTENLSGMDFMVYRSGYRNMQTASMASVTTQKNPITSSGVINIDESYKIVNASAVEYSDAWTPQCEFRLPEVNSALFNNNGDLINIETIGFNPYLYNIKGNFRAVKSYAYLAARNNGSEGFHPRNEGFFKTYKPFYLKNGVGWQKSVGVNSKWTFASQVAQYSPYGAEIENKDALNRFSAAQYGYRYTLPTAVGSNTQYKELGFDGFEDYGYLPLNGNTANPINAHFGYQDVLPTSDISVLTEEAAHTGRSSVKVNPKASLKVVKNLINNSGDPCSSGQSGVYTIFGSLGQEPCSKTFQIRANCTELVYESILVGTGTYIRLYEPNGNTLATINASGTGTITSVPFEQDVFIEIVSCIEGDGAGTTLKLKCNSGGCTNEVFTLN